MRESFHKLFEQEFDKAKCRVVAVQANLTAKKGVIFYARKFGIKTPYIHKLSSFMDTEIGSNIISLGVGFTFSYIPAFKNTKYASVLSGELKHSALSIFNIARSKITLF